MRWCRCMRISISKELRSWVFANLCESIIRNGWYQFRQRLAIAPKKHFRKHLRLFQAKLIDGFSDMGRPYPKICIRERWRVNYQESQYNAALEQIRSSPASRLSKRNICRRQHPIQQLRYGAWRCKKRARVRYSTIFLQQQNCDNNKLPWLYRAMLNDHNFKNPTTSHYDPRCCAP